MTIIWIAVLPWMRRGVIAALLPVAQRPAGSASDRVAPAIRCQRAATFSG
jgi:hypothetical protein